MKKIKKHKKIIIHCALIFMALFFVLRFAKEKYFDDAMNSYTARGITESNQRKESLTEKKGVVTREFTVKTDVLWGIGLTFERHQQDPRGEIEIEVIDEADKQLYQAITEIKHISNNKHYWLVFDEIIENSRGKVISVKLQVRDITAGDTLTLFPTIQQIYVNNAYLNKMFWAFALVVTLFVYGLYFILFVKRWKIEMIFLVFMLFAGMMYAFLVKPGAVPDEGAHYATAYAYSNIIMGKSNEFRAEVLMNDIDFEFYKSAGYPKANLSAYRDFQTDFLRREARGEMVPIDRWPIKAPAYLYTGQIIGVTLGRLIGFNGLTTFYLGRFFNVLILAILAFLAMKKLPFYKMSLFALCLFPMTAHLFGSFSYDGMILAISLILVSYILNLAFGEQVKNRIKELVVIIIAGVLIGGCKGGAYIPLLGLIFLIPMRYFKGRTRKAMFGGGVAIGTLVMFALGSMSAVNSSVGTVITRSDEVAYSIGWVFQNPLEFIQLLSNTVAVQSGFLFESLIGSELGWFNIPISSALVVSFFVIFLITCVYVREEPVGPILMPKQKRTIGIVLILSVAMIAAGMMFSWTPVGYPVIEGMQGRYFLPLLLPLTYCLKNTNLTLKKSLDKTMIFMLVWLHIMVFISVWGVAFKASV